MHALLSDLLEECRAARQSADPVTAMRAAVQAAVAHPEGLRSALGTPAGVGQTTLLQQDDLTVQRIVWGPGITSTLHEHGTWAVVGVYAGAELNVVCAVEDDRLQETARVRVGPGEVLALTPQQAHAVVAADTGWTEGLHIYGGDLTALQRREWIDGTPRAFDPLETVRAAAAYNAWVAETGRLPSALEGEQLCRSAGYPLPGLDDLR